MSGWFGRRAAPPAASPGAAQPPSGQGVPLELIRYDQATGKFELGQEALAVLKRTRTPVGVVAVCGRARQVRRRRLCTVGGAAAAGNATGATACACAAGCRLPARSRAAHLCHLSCCRASPSSSTSCWGAPAASRWRPPTAPAQRVRCDAWPPRLACTLDHLYCSSRQHEQQRMLLPRGRSRSLAGCWAARRMPHTHPTTTRCAGLWMWSSPVERRGPDGSKYSLVLLDTEGIDAYDQVRNSVHCGRHFQSTAAAATRRP